jgi:D-sedoheptulose 7-phosphate isomerase
MMASLEDAAGVVAAALEDAAAVVRAMLGPACHATARAAEAIRTAVARGGTVLVFGNGGSAAESQHFAAELVGRFERERPGIRALALTTDTSILTALANDYAFDRVFARQVEALGRPGDVAVGISTTGNSPNVVEGLKSAAARGLTTIGLTGRDGGAMGRLVDHHINVPHQVTARVQEVQLILLHAICDLVERASVQDDDAAAVGH